MENETQETVAPKQATTKVLKYKTFEEVGNDFSRRLNDVGANFEKRLNQIGKNFEEMF